MRRSRGGALLSTTVIAAMLLGGCASKKFVREQIAVVQQQQQGVDSGQDTRITKADDTANEALRRADAAGKLAEGKFNYSVVLSDASVKFPVDKSALSDEAKAKLAQLASQLKADNKNVYLEIQGFTDSTGSPDANLRLGEARAKAAYRYLHEQGVPAGRMATISYGEEHPVAPNNTRQGRAENRRIAVVVLN
ncbi:MAG TPA: OmpA family protein [Sphingobium sp.]|nr:OmpA family protein [Sphingobium sp.]